MSERLKGHLDGMLLAVLAEGRAHGYLVIERLRERSGGTFALEEGTAYPALHRLERAGLLASTWTTADGRRRRVYRLTQKGGEQLERSRSDWRTFSRAVDVVLA
jgi:PadR family transcriptional regulator PadR